MPDNNPAPPTENPSETQSDIEDTKPTPIPPADTPVSTSTTPPAQTVSPETPPVTESLLESKKSNPLFLIVVTIVLLAALGTLVYFGYNFFLATPTP